jgi:N-methylhydantoinase B
MPVRFHQYQFVEDTAGAGEHRGGPGTVREVEYFTDSQLQLITDRFDRRPYGLEGGQDGATGAAILNPGTDEERSVQSKDEVFVEPGDVARFYMTGGGGYGDPHERDEQQVRTDVENGSVSVEAARDVYDVDIDQ